MNIDFEGQLNDAQLRVVSYVQSPLLVLAGAGSGKTRCIIYRCAHLIKNLGVAPWNILVVTFTNKAARELQERLEKLLGFPVSSLWVGTFHSLCARILRYEHAYLPFSSSFSIYDYDAQKSLLKKIYKEHGYDVKKYPLNRVLSRISRYKNRLQLPEDLSDSASSLSHADPFHKGVLDIYKLYQQALLFNQAVDFDDILLYTARLLQDNDTVRAKYANQFKHVMIDEYQDTNHAQFEIIRQIAGGHHKVCVVGDDDQAIYSFRGATIRNILEFEKDYPEVMAIRLEQNYRSTMSILNLANAIIKKNRRRHSKDLWSERGEGLKPRLNIYEDENDEAEKVAQTILKLREQGIPLGQIAVLYRTNAQSRVFESAFMQYRIPHILVGSLHFYERKEIRDLLAYLNVISNPADSESLLRIINEPPRGIGQTTVNRVIGYANSLRIGIRDSLHAVDAISDLAAAAKKKLAGFSHMLDTWRDAARTKAAPDLVRLVIDELQLIDQYRKGNDPKEIARAENLMEFVNSVTEFCERYQKENERVPLLADFLPHVALQTDLDRVKDGEEALRLMTLHNAKGLEFSHVFIVGLEQELLPHRMSMGSREEIEEERRLFYVGVTRAKDNLSLSLARQRRLYGVFDHCQPSMFLQDLDAALFQGSTDESSYAPRPQPRLKTRAQITDKDKHYRIGQDVWHDDFGHGKVLGVNGTGHDATLTVSFDKGSLLKVIGTFLRTESSPDER
jgi:DNA helicase-2/ATP-dependent DNA helicase PcrA